MTDIDKHSRKYILQSSFITITMVVIGLAFIYLLPRPDALVPLLVSAAYSLVFAIADGMFWRMAAKRGADALTTFYTAVSGFRLLTVLAVMFIYYLVNGRESMLVFFIVFMPFYGVHLVHHSLYFSKLSNRS